MPLYYVNYRECSERGPRVLCDEDNLVGTMVAEFTVYCYGSYLRGQRTPLQNLGSPFTQII